MQPEAKIKTKNRRTEALRIRLTVAERAAVDAVAQATGVGPCSYARIVVLMAVALVPTPAPPRRKIPKPASRDLATVIGALGQISNNLNQLARSANSGFDIDNEIVKEAIVELRKLREAVVATRDDSVTS
ncbi:MobC family plasmid mobilization relaxosome protein [Tardiphaga sp. vice352]|uniref:plasmid mobilization protein n=1 Tax=Tardiphaga sp. vice352 TaxID=2592816 RepID=UPI0011631AC2|nr:plasmid mobilization relaxosome protein MobC [Tardiphaga sp. vice352]QDM32870.1 MobC family plasmid mobilization relaxosome protein [Tardiphaga sp. vice352]